MNSKILEHNLKAASTWGAPGRIYDEMSRSMASAIDHCIIRLDPKPGEKVLDVATGTGWGARYMARLGAQVTGVDFGKPFIEAAREIAAESNLDIDYQIADAEALPYPDGRFDIVCSTFGVMFASDQSTVASELSRVVRKGGRLALASWLPQPIDVDKGRKAGNGATSKIYAAYITPPDDPPPSPFNWGQSDWLEQQFGEAFDLRHEYGTMLQRFADGEAAWKLYYESFGPIRAIYSCLEPERQSNLKSDFVEFYSRFEDGIGITMPFDYLVTVGIRK